MVLQVGDIVAVPVANGRIGLAQVLELEPQLWVAVLRYEADETPDAKCVEKLKVLKDPGGLVGAVHSQLSGPDDCPFEVVGNVPPLTDRRFARPTAWSWSRLPAEVYFGGNSGLDLEGDDIVTTIVRQQSQEGARRVLDKIYKSGRATRAPEPEVSAPAPTHAGLPARFNLLDDDSVLIFASAKALAERYGAQPYDYDYPRALLQGIDARELAAAAHEYSELRIEIEIGAPHDHGRARTCGCVTLGVDDHLLVMGHAAFTRICDTHEGVAARARSEEYVRLAVPPATYLVSVLRVRGPKFSVRLAETSSSRERVEAGPTLVVPKV